MKDEALRRVNLQGQQSCHYLEVLGSNPVAMQFFFFVILLRFDLVLEMTQRLVLSAFPKIL